MVIRQDRGGQAVHPLQLPEVQLHLAEAALGQRAAKGVPALPQPVLEHALAARTAVVIDGLLVHVQATVLPAQMDIAGARQTQSLPEVQEPELVQEAP